MTFAIRIKENEQSTTPWRFEREFATEAEFRQVERLCINRDRIEIGKNFYVVRTDTLSNFSKDFFFPCLMGALKIHDYVTKVIMIVGGIILDLVTFPIRCLTLIPRLIINWMNTREKHPLHRYLVEQGASPEILNQDYVYMEKMMRVEDKRNIWKETFNFIEIPSHEHQATMIAYLQIPLDLTDA